MKIQPAILLFVLIPVAYAINEGPKPQINYLNSAIYLDEQDNCEAFVDEYEVWMDKYIDLMKKYKSDPTGIATSTEYRDMSMEMMNWASRWSELAKDCANYPEYESRFREIQEKAEKELKALGY